MTSTVVTTRANSEYHQMGFRENKRFSSTADQSQQFLVTFGDSFHSRPVKPCSIGTAYRPAKRLFRRPYPRRSFCRLCCAGWRNSIVEREIGANKSLFNRAITVLAVLYPTIHATDGVFAREFLDIGVSFGLANEDVHCHDRNVMYVWMACLTNGQAHPIVGFGKIVACLRTTCSIPLRATSWKNLHNRRSIILAGPNGAGKTTFANSFLPTFANCRDFLNAI